MLGGGLSISFPRLCAHISCSQYTVWIYSILCGLQFQRKVSYDNIDPDALPKLGKMSARKAQALLEQLNKQYADHELEDSSSQGETISLGIYYYEQDSSGESSP